MCMYICIYPNDKQCVTSVIVPIYNEIQKKRERERTKKTIAIVLHYLTNTLRWGRGKKLLYIVRNEDHCDKSNAIEKIETRWKQEEKRKEKKGNETKEKRRRRRRRSKKNQQFDNKLKEDENKQNTIDQHKHFETNDDGDMCAHEYMFLLCFCFFCISIYVYIEIYLLTRTKRKTNCWNDQVKLGFWISKEASSTFDDKWWWWWWKFGWT